MKNPLVWLPNLLSPRLKNLREIETIWETLKAGARRRLGSFEEARRTLDELTPRHVAADLRDLLDAHRETRELAEQDPVGDPKDVHHIIPPRHRIGYAVEDAGTYSLETFETLNATWIVLRCRGKLIGLGETTVVRMESYGSMHVM